MLLYKAIKRVSRGRDRGGAGGRKWSERRGNREETEGTCEWGTEQQGGRGREQMKYGSNYTHKNISTATKYYTFTQYNFSCKTVLRIHKL